MAAAPAPPPPPLPHAAPRPRSSPIGCGPQKARRDWRCVVTSPPSSPAHPPANGEEEGEDKEEGLPVTWGEAANRGGAWGRGLEARRSPAGSELRSGAGAGSERRDRNRNRNRNPAGPGRTGPVPPRGGGGGGGTARGSLPGPRPRPAAQTRPPPPLLPRAPRVPRPQLLPGPERGAGAAALPPGQGRHRRAVPRAGRRPGEPDGAQPRAAGGRQGDVGAHLPGLGLLPDGHARLHRHQPVGHVQLPGAVPGGAAAAGGALHRLPGARPPRADGSRARRRCRRLPRGAGAAGQHARGAAGAVGERGGVPQRPQLPLHEHAGGVRRRRRHHQRGGQIPRFLPQRRRAGEFRPGQAARGGEARGCLAAGRPQLPAEDVADDAHPVPLRGGRGALQRPAPPGAGRPAPDPRPPQAPLPLPGRGGGLPAVRPPEGLPDLPGLLRPPQHRPAPPHAPRAPRGPRPRPRARAAAAGAPRADLQRGPGRARPHRAAGEGQHGLSPGGRGGHV